MTLALLLVGVAIAGAFSAAALARFQKLAATIDAIVMSAVTSAFGLAAFAPKLAEQYLGGIAAWPDGAVPNELMIVAAAGVVASVFAIRTATVGETSLLFGATGVWAHVALAAISPGPIQVFLIMQTASWLGWVEINRRDSSNKTIAGLRWLLFHIAADIPLAFALVQLTARFGEPSWWFLQNYAARAAIAGVSNAAMSLLVLGLICSAGVRLAQFPLSVWLPDVVDSSRIGRGFALGLVGLPLGLLALERAVSLWGVSPVAQLLVMKWGPFAAAAAYIVAIGQRTPLATLAVAVSALMSIVVGWSSVIAVVSWPEMLLFAAAVRPAWTLAGRATCGLAFAFLYAVAVGPRAAVLDSAGVTDWLLEIGGILALSTAGYATACNRVSEESSDELTHPHWPGFVFLAVGTALLWCDGGGGLIGVFADLTVRRTAIGTVAFAAGMVLAKVLAHSSDPNREATTLARLGRNQFYIGELVAFSVVLPTRALAQVVRLIDWSTTLTAVLALSGGVMKRLDRESETTDLGHPSVGIALAIAALALLVLTVARVP